MVLRQPRPVVRPAALPLHEVALRDVRDVQVGQPQDLGDVIGVGGDAQRLLAREAARRSMVLLTNRNRRLPVGSDVRRIALIGPLADAPAEMLAVVSPADSGSRTQLLDAPTSRSSMLS